jgi:hypothetical protein
MNKYPDMAFFLAIDSPRFRGFDFDFIEIITPLLVTSNLRLAIKPNIFHKKMFTPFVADKKKLCDMQGFIVFV